MRRFTADEPISRASIWSRRTAVFALLLAAIAAAIIRLHTVEVTAGFAVLGAAFAFALVAVLLTGAAMVVIWRTGRKGARIALSGFFLALLILAYPAWLAAKAVSLPLLSDVSTDTANPPAFSRSAKALAARGGYTPPEVAAEARQAQRRAYPDIKPIIVDADPEEVYQTVLASAEAVGWRIVEEIPPGGRAGLGHVDAVAHSLILGLPADIAIRIEPLVGQTRIDVRSASRFGRHDFGTNAERIRAFAEELQAEIAGR